MFELKEIDLILDCKHAGFLLLVVDLFGFLEIRCLVIELRLRLGYVIALTDVPFTWCSPRIGCWLDPIVS
jgi:hypothetical protein